MLISHATRNLVTYRIRRLFGGHRCRIQVAALPWRKGEHGVEVMLVTSRGTGRWVLPKGWPKKGETPAAAAGREAAEEAGIKGDVAPHEIGRYFYEKLRSEGPALYCRVSVFPLEVEREETEWPEKEQRERRWMTGREATDAVAEPDLGELITRFCESQPGR